MLLQSGTIYGHRLDYAIIKLNGKQYKTQVNKRVVVDRMGLPEGRLFYLHSVLLHIHCNKVHIGQPTLSGVRVVAMVSRHFKSKKISILKHKRRKHYMKSQGYRSLRTEIIVTTIQTTQKLTWPKRKQAVLLGTIETRDPRD
ncbi:50S ribosomal protein L21 [Candidatus Tremblaya phenacola]|uniref:Large ribosomal subunit protein bL21 n=2 Tax=Candidatus Tremblayella phenacoccinincola TaxID=1010676 RepID=A0A2G0V776_9PROT|nr:50S ribosomal protein L21 [Candidatus Tremblaya phenacola]